jgi:hypothetical protein
MITREYGGSDSGACVALWACALARPRHACLPHTQPAPRGGGYPATCSASPIASLSCIACRWSVTPCIAAAWLGLSWLVWIRDDRPAKSCAVGG